MSKNIPIQPIHFYDHHIGAVREGFKNPPTENNFPVPSNTGTYFVWVTHVHPNLTPNRYIVSNMGKVTLIIHIIECICLICLILIL